MRSVGSGGQSLSEERTGPPRAIGWGSASMLVVASMIGTGVFTTSGFLLRDLGNAQAVLFIWVLGGVVACCGALAYAELTAALPYNGGEYALLTRIYHPSVGFVAGFISLVVGFAAPIAAAAVAFGAYAARLSTALDPTVCAVVLVLALSVLHAGGTHFGARIQDALTFVNLLLVLAFLVAGLFAAPTLALPASSERGFVETLLSADAAVGLVYVSFSYGGWNAACYVAGEVIAPERNIVRALLIGTGLVSLLYIGLNAVFLASAPPSALRSVLEVGHVAAAHLFGRELARWVSLVVAASLASSVGALIVTGSRIYDQMGRDHAALSLLVETRTGRGPARAIALQTGLALAMVISASFDALLTYVGVTLALSSGLTLAGVFVLRRREPELARPYRAWGHPFTTLLVLALTVWMVLFSCLRRPVASFAGLATIAAGFALYALLARRAR